MQEHTLNQCMRIYQPAHAAHVRIQACLKLAGLLCEKLRQRLKQRIIPSDARSPHARRVSVFVETQPNFFDGDPLPRIFDRVV